MDATAYLARIGLDDRDPAAHPPTLGTLRTVVDAHVTTVPFENLSIVGHPHGAYAGEGVSLSLPALHEKLVARRRGGFCFELNGLFTRLLADLGFDADRCDARIGGDADGLGRPPANHHTVVVHLDDGRDHLADVGTGTPQVRVPVPLDGSVIEDDAGVAWRVDPSDAALSEYALRRRDPGADGWTLRYRFRTEPRRLSYFAATCEFLANEPDGTFTRGPIVRRSTPDGWVALDRTTLTRRAGDSETETEIAPDAWDDVLAREFGIVLASA
jgi:N-hydroxyarylamine O-acetyltransferase